LVLLELEKLTLQLLWNEAVKAGISVYFTNTGNLIERLKIANQEGMLERS